MRGVSGDDVADSDRPLFRGAGEKPPFNRDGRGRAGMAVAYYDWEEGGDKSP